KPGSAAPLPCYQGPAQRAVGIVQPGALLTIGAGGDADPGAVRLPVPLPALPSCFDAVPQPGGILPHRPRPVLVVLVVALGPGPTAGVNGHANLAALIVEPLSDVYVRAVQVQP